MHVFFPTSKTFIIFDTQVGLVDHNPLLEGEKSYFLTTHLTNLLGSQILPRKKYCSRCLKITFLTLLEEL